MSLNLFKNLLALSLLLLTLPFVGPVLSPLQKLSLREGLMFCGSGILGIAVADSFLFASLNRIGVTRITIVDCLYSPSVIFCSWMLLGEDITLSHLLGASLIIAGILTSVVRRRGAIREATIPARQLWLGVLYGLAAIFAMAYAIVSVKPILEKLPLVWSTTGRLLVGTCALFLWMLVADRKGLKQLTQPNESWKYSIAGAFLGSYLSMIFWVGGFKYAKASSAGLLNQSTIIFAIPLSAIFLKESLTRPKLLAVALAVIGVLVVAFRPF